MALIAQPWHAHFEQTIIDGPVGFVAVGTIFGNRGMLVKKGPSSLRMAGVTVLVDAVLFELGRIRTAVRVVAIGADDLAFSHGHMRRAHQLRLALEMALAADLDLRPLVKERSFVIYLRKLETVAGFLHDGVTVGARYAPARVRACFPIRLHAALVTLETGLVLRFCRLSGILAECNQAADASAAAGSDMVAPRTVTGFTSLFFDLIAGVEQKDLAHHRLREFFELRGVAGSANLVARVSRRSRRRRLLFRRPERRQITKQKNAAPRCSQGTPHSSSLAIAQTQDDARIMTSPMS